MERLTLPHLELLLTFLDPKNLWSREAHLSLYRFTETQI